MSTIAVYGLICLLVIANFLFAERSHHFHLKYKEARKNELEAKAKSLRWREACLAQNRGLKRQSRKIFNLRSKITGLEHRLKGDTKDVASDNRNSRVGRSQIHRVNGKIGPSTDQQTDQGLQS